MKAAQEEFCPYGTTCWPGPTRSFAPKGSMPLNTPLQCLEIDDHKEDGQGRPFTTPASGRWFHLGGTCTSKAEHEYTCEAAFPQTEPRCLAAEYNPSRVYQEAPLCYGRAEQPTQLDRGGPGSCDLNKVGVVGAGAGALVDSAWTERRSL
jgi:hypothetical protein